VAVPASRIHGVERVKLTEKGAEMGRSGGWRTGPAGRRTRLAAVGLAALTALTACSGNDDSALKDPITFANAPGLNLTVESFLDVWQNNGIVLSPQTRTDVYGQWRPLTIPAGSDILSNQDPQTDQSEENSWNYEAVNEAWVKLADFLVNEWIDSELAWDDSAANRLLVAERVTESGWWNPDQTDGVAFLDLLQGDSAYMSGYALGPWAVDQDWQSWRQSGLNPDQTIFPPGQEDGLSQAAARQAEERYRARLTPAQPAPYPSNQPRSIVTSLDLGLLRSDDQAEKLEMTVHLSYLRPIVVDGVEGSRYEFTDVYLLAVIVATEDSMFMVELSQVGLSRTDIALIDRSETARAPRLPQAGASPTTGQAVGLLDLSFAAPTEADLSQDSTCQIELPEDWQGQFVGFELPELDGLPACLGVWAYPVESELSGQVPIYLTQTLWGYASGAVQGHVLIDSYPGSDTVLVELVGPTNQYRVEATVAPGSGTEFANRLLASFSFA
jgi:hypothetical protein